MIEKDRVLNYTNGELPEEGDYDIIRIKGIGNPKLVLEDYKKTMLVFLENKNLKPEHSQWEKLLPKRLVRFTQQLEEEDYHKDDIISHIPAMIDGLQRIRKWEWYSSQLTDDGFEVIIKGKYLGIFQPILHHHGIPHESLFVERKGTEYPTRALTDVLTYKTFDPITFELKKK